MKLEEPTINESVLIDCYNDLNHKLEELRKETVAKERDLTRNAIMSINPFDRGDIIRDVASPVPMRIVKVHSLIRNGLSPKMVDCVNIYYECDLLKTDGTERKVPQKKNQWLSTAILVKKYEEPDDLR